MRRYNEYKYSFWEMTGVISLYLTILALVSYLFYQSVLFFFISATTIPIFLKVYKKGLIRKQKEQLSEEFAETLYSVNANIKAGYALENAFVEAGKDIELFYGEKSLMAEEIRYIKNALTVNRTLESLLLNLGERSGVEDIVIFSKVFEAAKRNGGNLSEVIEKTADTVRAKFETEKEIRVLKSQKRLELKIMEIVPFFIIAYIGITSKGYFSVLYHNLKGVIFMSVCLIIYGLSVYLGSKMVEIDV